MAKKLRDLTLVLLDGHRDAVRYTDEPLKIVASGWGNEGGRGLVIRVKHGQYMVAVTDKHYRRTYTPVCARQEYTTLQNAKADLRHWLQVESLTTEDRVILGPVPRAREPRPIGNDGDYATNVQQQYNVFVSTPTGTYVVQS